MGSGYSKMKKQARAFEGQFEKMREEMKSVSLEGSSGSGLVTVAVNGEKEVTKITIKPECVHQDDNEGLQDLIIAALQDAYRKVDEQAPSNPLGQLPFGNY